MQGNNESYLVRDIIKSVYDNVTTMVFRVNTGSVVTKSGRRFSTGVPKGHPDIYGVLDNGRAFYIEAKKKPNKPTPEQVAFINKAKAYGALAGVCYSVDEAMQLLDEAKKG